MQHIIVNKNTGSVIGSKIYTTKGRAEGIIKKATVSDKDEWIAIPLPSGYILRNIAKGSEYGLIQSESNES